MLSGLFGLNLLGPFLVFVAAVGFRTRCQEAALLAGPRAPRERLGLALHPHYLLGLVPLTNVPALLFTARPRPAVRESYYLLGFRFLTDFSALLFTARRRPAVKE